MRSGPEFGILLINSPAFNLITGVFIFSARRFRLGRLLIIPQEGGTVSLLLEILIDWLVHTLEIVQIILTYFL